MKRTLILSTATALVLGLSGIAWAGAPVEAPCNVNGNANWSHEKVIQMIVNRHGNKGKGNGSEIIHKFCITNPEGSEDDDDDVDPGKFKPAPWE